MQAPLRKPRRTANACIACRQSKIKCSGDEPCTSCRRRFMKCRFAEGGHRVTVSERYLRDLRRQAKEQQVSPSTADSNATATAFGSSHDDDDDDGGSASLAPDVLDLQVENRQSSQPSDHRRSIWTSPFTLPSTIIKSAEGDKRNWIWLAPWSTWSFSARLTVMLAEKLHLESPYDAPMFRLAELYPLKWRQAPPEESPDISGLPSIDHALYLFNTVNFHLGQNYRFFDDEAFTTRLREFYYGNAAEKAAESRLWFVQFLLVLAFGKAFLSLSRNPEEPPGAPFFLRAMSLIPDQAGLWRESLLATEVLALASLYLYSIDHRETATLYLAQALVIAKFEGLHTELPEDQLGAVTAARCRSLWWTLYIMDRHFSSSVGLPMTTHDSDITTLLNPPSTPLREDTTLISLHVKLSQLLSHIHTSIYKTEKTELGTFLETTRSILHTMAGHAQEIEKIIHCKFQNSVETMPKGTRHITLLYHQCVIVATRPLLLSVLKERLESLNGGEGDWESFLGLITTLISTGIKSAVKTLQILGNEDSLLEMFLPFDLEFTYGAALHLLMANTLFPTVTEGKAHRKDAHLILDAMVNKGNKVAGAKKAELMYLEKLFAELAIRIESQGLQPLTLEGPEEIGVPVDYSSINQEIAPGIDAEAIDLSLAGEAQTLASHHPPNTTSQAEFLDNIGISSEELFSIVEEIAGQDNLSYSLLDAAQLWSYGQHPQ